MTACRDVALSLGGRLWSLSAHILALICGAALLLSACSPMPNSLAPSPNLGEMAERTGMLVNQHRASHELGNLALNELIGEQVIKHSQDMAAGVVPLGHDGFELRAEILGRQFPISAIAENVALCPGPFDPVQLTVKAWLDDPIHLRNIEGDYDLTGIGIAKSYSGVYYFTQMFVKLRH